MESSKISKIKNGKKYYPKSIKFYFAVIILMVFVLIFACGPIIFIVNWNEMQNVFGWLGLISSIALSIFFLYKLFCIMKKGIVLFDDKIYVQEDRGNKDTKLQYKIEIEFCQIEKIDMTTTSNNSLNHYMRFVITPMPYIVLHLADNREKRINVYYYSNKQTIEIIDYIIAKKKLTNPSFINKSGIELTSTLKKKSSFT